MKKNNSDTQGQKHVKVLKILKAKRINQREAVKPYEEAKIRKRIKAGRGMSCLSGTFAF